MTLLALASVCAALLSAGWAALQNSEQGRLYDAPRLVWPVDGEIVATTQPVLRWRNPKGAVQYELQVTPMSRRGSHIHMYGAEVHQYQPPAPPQWCCIERDTLYFWRVRVSFAEQPVTPDDDAWGPWSESWFYVARAADADRQPSEISLP